MDRELEIWSDSFHEGRWLLTEIGSRIHTFEMHFERGFLPVASLDFGSGRLTVRVFGDYDAWTPVPPAVKSALQFGKPDFVIYSREDDRVLFLGEETAAVPTGNQSTQRCERMVGGAGILVRRADRRGRSGSQRQLVAAGGTRCCGRGCRFDIST